MGNSKNKRVLVVDDDCEFRRSLKKLLQKAGYQVSQASNGIQASQMLSEKNYPLILLDIHMPGKSGLSVLNEVKGIIPDIDVKLSYEDLVKGTDTQLEAAQEYLLSKRKETKLVFHITIAFTALAGRRRFRLVLCILMRQ